MASVSHHRTRGTARKRIPKDSYAKCADCYRQVRTVTGASGIVELGFFPFGLRTPHLLRFGGSTPQIHPPRRNGGGRFGAQTGFNRIQEGSRHPATTRPGTVPPGGWGGSNSEGTTGSRTRAPSVLVSGEFEGSPFPPSTKHSMGLDPQRGGAIHGHPFRGAGDGTDMETQEGQCRHVWMHGVLWTPIRSVFPGR